MTPRILISTGEASGDAVGGRLLEEMRTLGFAGEAFAVGGTRLRAAGAQIIADSSTWGMLGVYQAVKKAPRLIAGGLGVLRWVKANKPDLVIAIDFGFLNVRVCKRAKRLGLKTFYFLPPGSWRKDRAGEDLPEDMRRDCDPVSVVGKNASGNGRKCRMGRPSGNADGRRCRCFLREEFAGNTARQQTTRDRSKFARHVPGGSAVER